MPVHTFTSHSTTYIKTLPTPINMPIQITLPLLLLNTLPTNTLQISLLITRPQNIASVMNLPRANVATVALVFDRLLFAGLEVRGGLAGWAI